MKKSISNLMQKIAHSDDKTVSGGFLAIRGGIKSTNDSCTNATCQGTNINTCTNTVDCTNTTNKNGDLCTNSGACLAM